LISTYNYNKLFEKIYKKEGSFKMAEYRDFTFNRGDFGKAEEYTDANSLILAIRNILLTRPGNYPFNPTFGMNIEKYQFELMDNLQIEAIKAELSDQINRFLPNLTNVFVDVQIVEDTANLLNSTDQRMVGIRISSNLNSEPITTNFLLYKQNEVLNIINETN
jgi:phage baseplate assembly protein W